MIVPEIAMSAASRDLDRLRLDWTRLGAEDPLWAVLIDAFPYLKPSFTGLSLTLSTPFLFWAVRARGPLVAITWLAVALVLLPDVTHGSWGFAQFGYRFILDAVPLLLLLLGWAYRERASWSLVAAVAFSVAVHAWGIWVVNLYGFGR